MHTFNFLTLSSRLRYLIITIIFAAISNLAFCQAMVVYGKIVSDNSGLPVIGAIVLEQGSNNQTTSDLNGDFSFSVKSSNATIEVSCIGYDKQTIMLAGKGGLGTIELKETPITLSDVLVTSQVAVYEPSTVVTVIVASPSAFAVIKPEGETVATSVSSLE